jgi:eukaryotic-like serine/threonine-protein kinase
VEDLPQRFGKYLLLRRVAVGGMAEIFLAVEKSPHGSHRFVTIKRIKADFDRDDEYVQFFLTEGRVSLKCAHPNLPQAYEMGAVDGSHYLALEYIHGHTLLDVVRAGSMNERPLSIETAVNVGVCVAAALEHAHGLRDVDGQSLCVVHRDVTPQNVMISLSGAVKLIDFGIVRSVVQTHRTASGVVKGKFSYMAPESLASGREFDHRADLFALGIVLHETLTGRSLFRGVTDNDTLRRVRTMPVPDVTRMRGDTPPALATVIARALERDPDRRFQTATDFLHALESAAEEAHVHRSVTRMRDEVLQRCGDPPFPSLTEEERALLEDTTPHAIPGPPDAVQEDAAITVAEPVSPALHDALALVLGQAQSMAEATSRDAPLTDAGAGPGADAPSASSSARATVREPARGAMLEPAHDTPRESPRERPRETPPPDADPMVMSAPMAERDPQLAYFLRQAALHPAGSRRTEEQAPSDSELAELIAALDQ